MYLRFPRKRCIIPLSTSYADNKRERDWNMMSFKKIAAAVMAVAMTLAVVPSAFACTALYVGSDLTEDGTTMFGRIEDLGTNDYNKLF